MDLRMCSHGVPHEFGPCEFCTQEAYLRSEVKRLKSEGSAAGFACHLINNCERSEITEELIRRELVRYMKGNR